MSDYARKIADVLAESVYEHVLLSESSPDEPPVVLPPKSEHQHMYDGALGADDKAAMEFITPTGKYRVLVYKTEE